MRYYRTMAIVKCDGPTFRYRYGGKTRIRNRCYGEFITDLHRAINESKVSAGFAEPPLEGCIYKAKDGCCQSSLLSSSIAVL